MNPVIFIVGPTACGKSEVALELAEHLQAGILNCDSLQVYQRLDIGTAKPSRADRGRAPHYLFDVMPPGSTLSAGEFRRLALAELHQRVPERPVLAVGGSGFYIQALEKGMFEVDRPKMEVEREVRDRLQRRGAEAMYEELRRLDPDYADQISANDEYRVTRALIVIHDTGKKMSQLRREFKPEPLPFPHLKLGLQLEREALRPRVEARTTKMLKAGLIDEVRVLLAEGFQDWPALQSVGYKECVQHLRGALAATDLPGQIVEKTLQLAKKQRTWFKRDHDIHWLASENPLAEALAYVKKRDEVKA